MSQGDVNPTRQTNALTLATELIRKLDDESNKKLEHVSAESKNREKDAA
jgi:hypothetical protein